MNSKRYNTKMNTISMNSGNGKTSDPHRLLLNFKDKISLRRKDKYISVSNLSLYYIWKNIKKPQNNNKFKISARTWNDELELPHGLDSISDIQDHFEYIFKKHGEKTVDPSIRIYINKIENRMPLKLKQDIILNF